MVSAFLICAIAFSIVGGVAAPIAKIIFSTYTEERKRLEGGGKPVYPQSLVHPEIFEEMDSPKSQRHQEVN